MALATVIAGGYTATYDGTGMGQQEDGFKLRMSFASEEIRSNTYGDSVIDFVYRGGNCYLQGIFIERDSILAKAATSPTNPYGTGGAVSGMGLMGTVGRLGFGLSKSIVMTAIPALAAASSIATLTGTNGIIDQNLNTEIGMANRASFVPLTFRLLPFLSTDVKWFSVT